jgi:hypothetical protein
VQNICLVYVAPARSLMTVSHPLDAGFSGQAIPVESQVFGLDPLRATARYGRRETPEFPMQGAIFGCLAMLGFFCFLRNCPALDNPDCVKEAIILPFRTIFL